MHKGLVTHLLCVAICLSACAAAAREHVAAGVTQAEVDAALEKGSRAALQNLARYVQSGSLGYSVVGVMAVLNAGVPRDDPTVQQALKFVLGDSNRFLAPYEGTYDAGLVCVLLHMLKDPRHRRVAERMAQALQSFQAPIGGWGDNSRTQFALLGLKAAQDLGVKVPAEVFKRARRYVESGQKADGSWYYIPVPPQAPTPGYGSMTAAGITSLFIINEQANKESAVCGASPGNARIQKALEWLGEHFTVESNPLHPSYHHYYLYALERIGVLTGQKYIGGRDWYREGAGYLVRHQQDDGNWNDGSSLATEFALLFLGKGRDPVVMQKLAYGRDWNSDPYDAKDLVEQASRDLKLPMTCQTVDASAAANALSAAPILYLQGHSAVSFTRLQRADIKAFVEQGGFVIASACCGSTDFDKTFRTEMALIFPDAAFEALPASHEIYAGPHKIAHPENIAIEGLNTGCRTSVLYSPHDICCAWGGCRGCTDKAAVREREATNLGVNMIAYALDFKQMRGKLEPELVLAARPGAPAERNTVLIGQLHHNGDSNPDPGSLANLGKTLKDKTGCAAEFVKRQVVPGTDDLGDFPLLYITGHRSFEYAPAQVSALREYLNRGGFLLADPCCGKAEFDIAFRRLCAQLFPDRPLAPVPAGHAVLKTPYLIEKVEYKPAVKKRFPDVGDAPQLEAVISPDGRLQILYSRFNLGCELQGHTCANCLGLAGKDAYRVAVNAVLYALSH